MIEKGRNGLIRPSTLVRRSDDWAVRRGDDWATAASFRFLNERSPTMKSILRDAVETGIVPDASDAKTRELMMESGLCDSQDRLTEKGRVEAISVCALRKQCKLLGLPMQVMRLPITNKPELAVMASLKTNDRTVAHCEGGAIALLLYCLCFDRLYAVYKAFAADYGSSDPSESVKSLMYCVRFVPDPKLLTKNPELSQMVADIANGNEGVLVRSFDTLMSWQRQPPGFSDVIPAGCWREYKWVGVDRDLVLALFRAFGAARWAVIAEQLLIDGFGIGWPDLIWVEGATVGFTEVKTSDKLLPSQIVTFPRIMQVLNIPVHVVQVQRIGV